MLPRTTPTASVSLSTTTAWWAMPGCSFRPPSPSTWACGNSGHHLDLAGAGAGQHGGQDTDAGRFRAGWRRLHRRRRCAARRWDGPHPGRHDQGGTTLGTFLRSFRWGHVRQLDRVSRELLARAWQSSAGPGDSPLTIDLDSTICEPTDRLKEGARHHGYTGKRGYHPLLAVAARNRRRAGAGCARAGPTPLVAPPTSCVKRWGGCATEGPAGNSGAGRQRLLHP